MSLFDGGKKEKTHSEIFLSGFVVEIVAPLLTPNLQPQSNQFFPKSLIYNQICKTSFANHCTTLQKCGYNVGTFADILYICIDEKFEHYGSFICT